MRAFRSIITLLLVTAGTGNSLAGTELQSHASIRDSARDYILQRYLGSAGKISAEAGKLDSRLRLAKCTQALETFSAPGRTQQSRQTVGVRCSGEQPWTLFVPVTVSVWKKVLVSDRALSRGDVIRRENIISVERDVLRLHRGYMEEAEAVLGMKLKRGVNENDVFTPDQLVTPLTVERGQQVVITARIGALKVEMEGEALADGAIGERVPVLNKSSKREIEATVMAPGIVQVSL